MDSQSLRSIADMFAIGLLQAPTVAFTVTLLKSSYARKDFQGPMAVCAVTAVFATLAFPMAAGLGGPRGLIIAAACERWLNAAGMALVEFRANRRFRLSAIGVNLARLTVVSTAIAFFGRLIWLPAENWLAGNSSLVSALQLSGYCALVLLLWFAVTRRLRLEEAESLESLIRSVMPGGLSGLTARP
jgi:peptidoglycan biosynthesis protein MviN/MurJ (putative lipid II flippase)